MVPIGIAAFGLLEASAAVEAEASTYLAIRIWSAPGTLVNYALLGWFLGQQRPLYALALQLLLNITNIVLDIVFVLVMGWGVAGVAAATVLAETLAAAVGLVLALRLLPAWPPRRAVLDATALRRLVGVNRDIFIRTLCLIFGFAWHTNQSARLGDAVLAANAAAEALLGWEEGELEGRSLDPSPEATDVADGPLADLEVESRTAGLAGKEVTVLTLRAPSGPLPGELAREGDELEELVAGAEGVFFLASLDGRGSGPEPGRADGTSSSRSGTRGRAWPPRTGSGSGPCWRIRTGHRTPSPIVWCSPTASRDGCGSGATPSPTCGARSSASWARWRTSPSSARSGSS